VGEDRTNPPSRRLTVDQAADALGVTAEAIRGRIRRDTIAFERVGGRVYVLLPDEQQTEQTPDQSELVAVLREQLAAERQAHAEARRIIAGLVERLPPQLEAPSEARESTQTERAEPRPDSAGAQEGARRPWWRRMFGG
jgi:hypothetical protein